MLRYPIRIKLIVGLSVVVGMMLILMGGSLFGLHSFHMSNLKLVDQLRELGASKVLMETMLQLRAPRNETPEEVRELKERVEQAQKALLDYFWLLKKNTTQGNRADSGFDELGLAFLMDDDLAAVLHELDSAKKPVTPLLPGTSHYVGRHPELLPPVKPAT